MPPSTSSAEAETSQAAPSRQVWVDNLRTFTIALVVNMHACCTYSHVGGWYMTEGPDLSMNAKIPYFFWQGHLQAFFMGLLFFLAGHYAARALARRDSGAFLKERFRRLVLPSFLYMLALHPFIVVGLNPYGIPAKEVLPWLGRYYTSLKVVAGNGPLWFALALFVFCLAFALFPKGVRQQTAPKAPPSVAKLLGFGTFLILATFLMRLWQPIGQNILNFQLCFFPQYILAFAVGAVSWRQGWLETLARTRRAKTLGWCGLVGGPILLTLSAALRPPVGNPPELVGGWNLAAFLYSFWEQAAGLGLGLGCLALFVRLFDKETRASRWLSDHSFAVYVIHAPVLVALTMVFASLQAPVAAKILLLTITGLVASYALAWPLRKIPALGRIL